MICDHIFIENESIPVISLNTAVIGSGAAGFNAAVRLYDLGQKDVAIFTEGINMGTSRNTGSDKQTYYKLSLEGSESDSCAEMAKTLYNGGCMHGDTALIEAALSARCYFNLVEIGVPFPHNKYGEYAGYKTDHDPRKRATSAGPLTSKIMTEKLEMQVLKRGIQIFDGNLVIKILTERTVDLGKKAYGFLVLDLTKSGTGASGLVCINCTNIVLATGGPAGMYESSVYPLSQNGSTGIAFEAGCKGVNLTESQFGIASKKFRWNLSGTYQQVIPRYISSNADGTDEKEFLDEYFSSPSKMLDAIFLKGYQWPFDPRKIEKEGSSLIDLLVYNETQIRGRRVYLDYTNNPSLSSGHTDFRYELLGNEAYEYLKRSGALSGRPIDRLEKMNSPAVELFLNNGIDLRKELLEIDVCAQHNNGGLTGNIWYESNVKNLFPVGEVNGTFGVYRPGGSALNSTQVSGLRAAQYITANHCDPPVDKDDYISKSRNDIGTMIALMKKVVDPGYKDVSVYELDKSLKNRMSKYGSIIRNIKDVSVAIGECRCDLMDFEEKVKIGSGCEPEMFFKTRNNLLTQFVYLCAIREYIQKGGASRGSYIVADSEGFPIYEKLTGKTDLVINEDQLKNSVNEIELVIDDDGYDIKSEWIPTREIPISDNWFENVWKDYRDNKIIR
jgi:succinate dehydrogenase/fumarate reductase flavoprotein subunit